MYVLRLTKLRTEFCALVHGSTIVTSKREKYSLASKLYVDSENLFRVEMHITCTRKTEKLKTGPIVRGI